MYVAYTYIRAIFMKELTKYLSLSTRYHVDTSRYHTVHMALMAWKACYAMTSACGYIPLLSSITQIRFEIEVISFSHAVEQETIQFLGKVPVRTVW